MAGADHRPGRTARYRGKVLGLILGAVLLAGFLFVLAPPLVRRGLAWWDTWRHFRNCRTLQIVTTRFYTDHQADNPRPEASFTALKNGGYIDEKFIKHLIKDEGVYCFFLPPSANPADPLIGYFSKKDTVIFSVKGEGGVFQDHDAPIGLPR